MNYSRVYLESIGYAIPSEIWTSDQIESRLEPLYSRLRLPHGRLELMTGIRERRFWPAHVSPSAPSILSGNRAIEAAQFDRDRIGCLIHGSVCRDYLEPATASKVHHELRLPQRAVIYDLSNACLGILNGMLQVANMIELGQIDAGLVVGSEIGRQLVDTTIAALNRDQSLTRKTIKDAFASLTIGSASCAILLCHERVATSGTKLLAAASRAHTKWHGLCQSDEDQAGSDFQPLMATDSHELMMNGIQTAVATFNDFLTAAGWSAESIDKTICHQVGAVHRKLMLDALGLPYAKDFPTFPWLGNTGSAALPITLAKGAEDRFVASGDNVALLGIGSGINSVMIGLRWNHSPVAGIVGLPEPQFAV